MHLNSIKIRIAEAHYHIDDILVERNGDIVYEEDFEDFSYGPYVDYIYNTNDERVMKISLDISDGKIMLYINDGNGKVLSEYNRNGVLKYNYIFGNGSKLAKKDASDNVNYYHNDYLGSARAVNAV
ncbi:MAG: hypothetical protein ISS81_01990 [Candidatus Marinimicrobia bacterium]|nr:hypothetical protein [Candidatus Neomarinimicrobiota bacterium]